MITTPIFARFATRPITAGRRHPSGNSSTISGNSIQIPDRLSHEPITKKTTRVETTIVDQCGIVHIVRMRRIQSRLAQKYRWPSPRMGIVIYMNVEALRLPAVLLPRGRERRLKWKVQVSVGRVKWSFFTALCRNDAIFSSSDHFNWKVNREIRRFHRYYFQTVIEKKNANACGWLTGYRPFDLVEACSFCSKCYRVLVFE